MRTETELDKLVVLGCKVVRQIGHRESLGRLTGRAMTAQACEYAGCDEARLDALQAQIDAAGPEADPLRRFVHRFASELRGPQWSECPRDAAKATRVYSGDRDLTRGALHELGCLSAEVVALAVRHAARSWPDAFGKVENPVTHRARLAELRAELEETKATMRRAWSAHDVESDPRISPALRDEGYARQRFRKWPQVFLLPESDWPAQLIAAALAKADQPAPEKAEAAPEPLEDARPIRRRIAATLQSS